MAETDEEELTTAGIRPAGFRGAAYDIHAVGKTPIHDGYRLKSCRLVHWKEDKCFTVLAGRTMLALDEDYRMVSFIMEDMYGDTRADIRRSSELS